MMSFWDQQFSAAEFKYGTSPNAFLREQATRLAPNSTVLVPGDGEGRNGVWLAEQGHRVTSVDNSTVGLAKAQALASERGVSIETVCADLGLWRPTARSSYALVLVYVHFPPLVRTSIHRQLLAGLRAGGVLILEAFHPRQLGRASGGPKDVTMLYTLDMLRADVAGVPDAVFDECVAWEGETHLDEGPGHRGDAHVTRFVAQRV
ncbi:MAG: class I SAM-dependent methyltransferase [Gemmatimonadaceae bacterium]|nr:class I SAM-dependent methyltransferase [Gemmatimonadaceae bacterium]